MNFLTKISMSLKEARETLYEGFQKAQDIADTKKRILNRFEISDLKKICVAWGIGEPPPYKENSITGERHKRTVTRAHYIRRVIDRMTLDQIMIFADKHRIKIRDILEEEISNSNSQKIQKSGELEKKFEIIEPKTQSVFGTILRSIKEGFEAEEVRDENDFEKQLTQFLKIKYPHRIKRQVKTSKGQIDIVVDGRYALELKIADSKVKLRNLIGQASSYKKVYGEVAVILLDVGKISHSEIKEYANDYENHMIRTIVLKGILQRKKSKSKQISIRI